MSTEEQQELLASLRQIVDQASPEQVTAMLHAATYKPKPGEHIVQLNNDERMQLLKWMASPNGGLQFGHVCFEAVVNGGLMVRTLPYDYAIETAARAKRKGDQDA